MRININQCLSIGLRCVEERMLGDQDLKTLSCDVAAMGKLLWDIASKKENLWVRWMFGIYLKDSDFWHHECPLTGSWYWKKLCEIRDILGTGFRAVLQTVAPDGLYTIASGYNWLKGEQRRWDTRYVVWHRKIVLRHAFILWVALHRRLLIIDHLQNWFPTITDTSVLCVASSETHNHLFFECVHSNEFLQKCCLWMGFTTVPYKLQ